MTSLHYTLIALGIGLVGAVMLYNIYQERRSRKQAERLFELREQVDPVSLTDMTLTDALPDTRIEPHLDIGEDEQPGFEDDYPAQQADPIRMPEPAREVEAERSPAGMAPESPLDSEIEYVARLRYSQPTAVLFASLIENLRRISKPIRLVGRRADGAWEVILGHAERPYDTVELALLLADRSGPVSDVQIDTLCRRLYEFATEHGGAVSCQDKSAALERAKSLDAFCAEVDMLIGLNVIAPESGGFSGRAIHDLADRAGLTQALDGSYSLKDASGQTLFTLNPGGSGAGESVQGVALLFDVPRVANGLEAFDRMTDMGLHLADELGGRLVDDGGRPVNRSTLDRDRQALQGLYDRLAARGIPAGGERALRLFA